MTGLLQVVPVIEQIRRVAETNGTELAVFSLLLVVSAVGLAFGLSKLYNAYAIWSNEPIPAGQLHTADTVVELEGTAELVDEPTESPYTNTPSVAYEYKKERRKTRTDEDGNTERYWDTVASGRDAVPFVVTDNTGEAAVNPEGATLEAGTDYNDRSGNIRRTERRLEPGDSVHVYGQKHEHVTADGKLGDHRQYVADGGNVTTFQITQGGELHAVAWTAGKATLFVVGSVVVGAAVGDQLLRLFGIGPFLFQ